MNIKDQIHEIFKNKFLRCNENLLKKKYYNIWRHVLNNTTFLPTDTKLAERTYCFIHNIKENIKCQTHECNNYCNFNSYTKGYSQHCCNKCAQNDKKVQNKTKKTCMEKYGVSHHMKSKKVQEKRKQTCMEKYGVTSPFESKEVKEKIKQTCMEKYGVTHPKKSQKVKNKCKQKCLEKYGVENVFQLEKTKNKIKQTCMKKYGVENVMFSNEIKYKCKQSNLKNYNVENVFQLEKTKNKIKETCMKKYGVSHCNHRHISKDTLNKLNNKEWLKTQQHKLKKSCLEIASELNISITPVISHMQKHEITIKNHYSSRYEKEIVKFINIANIQTNVRNIISPYELDIYLPDYKLAIEFDGLYWHSRHSKNYHLNKTQMCEEKNIQLLHIFENEWLNIEKQKIWKSIINGKLSKNNRIFARKCEIKEICDNSLVKEFLNNNHLQGFVGSSIKLGLFYKNGLISIMTFGKTRFSKKYEYEMIRFCNKKFFGVIGGASKLLKYFTRNYKPDSIVSYADRRYSNGNLYNKLGFEFSHNSAPNYWYFKNGSFDLYSRIKFQKHKLRGLLENFNSDKTEVDNMLENKYLRIFDCGNIIYSRIY